jgi:hypothetical protein
MEMAISISSETSTIPFESLFCGFPLKPPTRMLVTGTFDNPAKLS